MTTYTLYADRNAWTEGKPSILGWGNLAAAKEHALRIGARFIAAGGRTWFRAPYASKFTPY